MLATTIKIKAKKILDSKKKPTLAVELSWDKRKVWAAAPAGTSAGRFEAKPRNTDMAIKNVNKIIAPALKNFDLTQQEAIDNFLIQLDGTKNKARLGANAIIAVSLAVCRAGAALQEIPLCQYIQNLKQKIKKNYYTKKSTIGEKLLSLPKPCFNIINGGVHAPAGLDFQEFMLVPQANSFAENLRIGQKVYHQLKKILFKKFGSQGIKIGLEGGFVPPLNKPEEAIELILMAASQAKIKQTIKIFLDVAASQFFKKNHYQTKFGCFTADELIDYYGYLVKKYPIGSLEDPLAEKDWSGWTKLMKRLKNILIIGDDLTVTNPQRIKLAHQKKACRGVIIKPNQIGTLSETLKAICLAQSYGWTIIVSHRSGETLDDFIADLAVGVGADYIKSGAPFPKERMVKYQRLVKIEKEINS